ncbi:hypothetical protein BKA65DRAFT_477870 [Rhexocercosporidium sp. MPI-PUGE-AT-0058]|nr:hypothetical protein BKA65DRAFT_477870 [Rhexocercosporidium sp. MPI-PUGE-AT-0058]
MSATISTTIADTMPSLTLPEDATQKTARGTFLYIEPDETALEAEQRPFFGLPSAKRTEYHNLAVHDMRTSPSLKTTNGPQLDIHGFTFTRHTSSLSGDEWFSQAQITGKYLQEVEALLKAATGAKKIAFSAVLYRRKLSSKAQAAPYLKSRRREEDMVDPTKTVSDKVLNSPFPFVHIDYTKDGTEALATKSRYDIEDIGAEAMASGARVAAFSVWRPLKTVKRDPLAIMDRRSLDPNDLVEVRFRMPNGRGEDKKGEFVCGAYNIKPENHARHMWYWLPEQSPEEVLIIKFTDSADPDTISTGSPHTCFNLDGTEGILEPRESIEVKCIAFW